MSKLPKLKVRRNWDSVEEIRDFEQAKYLPFHDFLILVDGQVIRSYEELVQLAAQDSYRDRKSFEVVMVRPTGGG